MQQDVMTAIDFQSDIYRDAYSRINAIVIEGEQEAAENYVHLTQLLGAHTERLLELSRMETRHKKGFEACGRNLKVEPDMAFARRFFAGLHHNFQEALAAGRVVPCLVIQSLIIEAFAIAAYNIYIPVADPFARRITEGVVKDEYLHLNFGQAWLKANFEAIKDEIIEANRQNLPLVRQMLDQVEADAACLGMEKSAMMEDFAIAYSDALEDIGFTSREIVRMTTAAMAAV